MRRRDFLALASAGAAGLLASACAAGAARKPNIILIVADDLGYGDVCCYGCHGLETPHIDSIAANGALCPDGHVTAPVCSPSRAGFITGRYQQRFGHEFNAGNAVRCEQLGLGLPTTETTIADALKAAGYATGMVGKSHLGSNPQFHPMERGLDEFFGFLHGSNLYIDPSTPGVHNASIAVEQFRNERQAINPIMRGKDPVEVDEYLTDVFTREALGFIDRHKSEPFFLYLPFNAPHTPLQATEKYYNRFSHIEDEKKRIYAAMVSAMDDGIGKVLEKVKSSGLWEDTIVVFFSDNGCATYTEACYNDPLLGGKLMLFEGGQRVPFVVQWPGHIPAGTVYKGPVSSLDVYPTVVKAAGGNVPADRDGVDMMPYLKGEKTGAPERALYWRTGTNSAVRKGKWKLVNLGEGTDVLLYDLSADIGEEHDLSAEHPDKVKELSALLEGWKSGLVDPLWPSRRIIPFQQGPLKFELFI